MRPRRPMCSSLAILCAIAIATASMPAVAAPTHDAIEPAPVDAPPVDAAPAEPTTPSTPDPLPDDAPPVEPAPTAPTKPAPPSPPPIEPPAKPKPEAPPEAVEEEIPERLAPLQIAGWWTLFGGVSIGTLAAVMAGLAERQEDRALRLSVFFDIETRAQSRYEDVQGEYEAALRKGRAEANAGIALAVIGLGAAVAGVAMLAVAAKKQRRAGKPKPNARVQWRMGGMQVRF